MQVSKLYEGDRVYWNNDRSDKGTVIKIDEEGQVLIKWDKYSNGSGDGWIDAKDEHLIDLV